MGIYFNPTDRVRVVGRVLISGPYEEMRAALRDGEVLVGLYRRLDRPWKNAVVLVDSCEFDEFESQVEEGCIVREGYFAVPSCEDGFDRPPVMR